VPGTTGEVRYRPGTWWAAAGGSAVLLAEGGCSERRLSRIWSAVRAGDAPERLLESAVRAVGGGRPDGDPPCAVAVLMDGRVRVLVRPGATAGVLTSRGERLLAAPGTGSWADETVPAPLAVILARAPAPGFAPDPPRPAAPELPLLHGVVLADAVTWWVAPGGGAHGNGRPASVRLPEPAPVRLPGCLSGRPWTAAARPALPVPAQAVPGPMSRRARRAAENAGDAGRAAAGRNRVPAPPAPGPGGQAWGTLTFSTGQTVPLSERTVRIGRAPSAHRVRLDGLPLPLRVGADNPVISRNHVEVRWQDGQMVAVDLRSRNGTVVELPGCTPRTLEPERPFPLRSGAVVSLSPEVSFVFREPG